jgi:protein gp37
MGVTAIEWADLVFNPTTGCDRISPGCDLCYALRMAVRLKAYHNPKYQNDGDPRTSGPGFGVTEHPDVLDAPFTQPGWGGRKFVFVDSMADLLHAKVSRAFLRQVIGVMRVCEQHTFLLLTKRAERLPLLASEFVMDEHVVDDGPPVRRVLPNLWLGVSVESTDYYTRIHHLVSTPAARRFLSLEPLLGPLPNLPLDGIDWVIVGGESGPGARPMHPAWVRAIRDQCTAAGVPFWFKQWGAWSPIGRYMERVDERQPWDDYVNLDGTTGEAAHSEHLGYATNWTGTLREGYHLMSKVGKKKAGRVLDGRTWLERPPHHEMAVSVGPRQRPRRPAA